MSDPMFGVLVGSITTIATSVISAVVVISGRNTRAQQQQQHDEVIKKVEARQRASWFPVSRDQKDLRVTLEPEVRQQRDEWDAGDRDV